MRTQRCCVGFSIATPHGVINKPIRPFGILSSLVLARSMRGYTRRLESKVQKLEETLKARRDVDKAVKILVTLKGISEAEAYELIPLAGNAEAIVDGRGRYHDHRRPGRDGGTRPDQRALSEPVRLFAQYVIIHADNSILSYD